MEIYGHLFWLGFNLSGGKKLETPLTPQKKYHMNGEKVGYLFIVL